MNSLHLELKLPDWITSCTTCNSKNTKPGLWDYPPRNKRVQILETKIKWFPILTDKSDHLPIITYLDIFE